MRHLCARLVGFSAIVFTAMIFTGIVEAGIHDVTYRSALNSRDVVVKVYTPPGYEKSDKRYPVVYNLHGGGGSPDRQWERTRATVIDAIEGGKVRPLIYVYASGLGGDTLFLDYADGSLKAESTVVKELIPFIDNRYRTIASHEGRAIEGFSMGGFGALKIAFRYPTLFSTVISYGGAVLSPDTVVVGGPKSKFPTKEYFDANTPWGLMESNRDRIAEHLRIRLVCGDKDEKWYPGNLQLKERAEKLKVTASWIPVAGVEHETKSLYERTGLDNLKFIEEGFAPELPRKEGIAKDILFRSELNNRDVWLKVYTPPGYESGKERYPVVYNLHGAGGGSPQRQWKRAGATLKEAIETAKVRPMIYVFLDGLGDTFFIDSLKGERKPESLIVREVIPYIDRTYRTIASREGRSVDGFSMGGFGALMLATKYPEMFGSVVSYGAALITGERASAERFGSREHFQENSPWSLVRKNAEPIRSGLRIRMVCGDADGLFKNNLEFKAVLDELQIPYQWVPVPGVAHDTAGLYRRVGVDSLKFMETGFAERRP